MHHHLLPFHLPLRIVVRLLGALIPLLILFVWLGVANRRKREQAALDKAQRDALLGRDGDAG